MHEKSIIERALEHAQSGDYDKPFDIARRLSTEGYADARAHLEGRAVKAMLRKAMNEARKAKAETRSPVGS
jgi:hypothetical protein